MQKNSVGVNKNAKAGNFGKAFAHNGFLPFLLRKDEARGLNNSLY